MVTEVEGAGRRRGADGGRAARVRVWVPVALVVLGWAAMVGLNLNGSSVAMLGTDPAHDRSLVLGTPRPIRSDEWALSTPVLVGIDRQHLPQQQWIGLTPTYMPAIAIGVASASWVEAFRPIDWGFFLLSPSRAFSWRWWALLLTGFLGCYALLHRLTRAPVVAAGLAVVVAASPAVAWWSQTPAEIVGSLAAATAALLAAFAARRALATVLFGLLAGYLTVMSFLALYPPWLVSVGLVCTAVTIGWVADHRPRPRRVLTGAGCALLVAVPAVLVWYLQGRDAITATANTYYPGRRAALSGEGNLAWLLDAPTSLWLSATRPPALSTAIAADGSVMPTNQSEASASWLPLPVLAAVLVVVVWVLVSRRTRAASRATEPADDDRGAVGADDDAVSGAAAAVTRPVWTALALVACTLLLLAWAVLPLPGGLGTLTGLSLVPGRRLPLSLGLAAALLLAVCGPLLGGLRTPRWLTGVLALGGVGTVAALVWANRVLTWGELRPDDLGVAGLAAVLALGSTLLAAGRLRGSAALLLAALAVVVYLPVNPLTQGLGPLDRDPLVKALAARARTGTPPRTVLYGRNAALQGLVSGSGVTSLSGLTVYPDASVWATLAPTQKNLWNNYGKYSWMVDPTARPARLQQFRGTQVDLYVDPCSAQIRALHIDLSLSASPIDLPCLTLEQVVHRDTGVVYLYGSR